MKHVKSSAKINDNKAQAPNGLKKNTAIPEPTHQGFFSAPDKMAHPQSSSEIQAPPDLANTTKQHDTQQPLSNDQVDLLDAISEKDTHLEAQSKTDNYGTKQSNSHQPPDLIQPGATDGHIPQEDFSSRKSKQAGSISLPGGTQLMMEQRHQNRRQTTQKKHSFQVAKSNLRD